MARNKDQNESMRQERLKNIKSSALHQFVSKGLFATKIKDIAQEVGMAQGLIYHYYKSKDDIYIELIDDALSQMNIAIEALKISTMLPHEKISAAIIELLKTIEISPEFNQTCRLIAEASNSTAIPEKAKKMIDEKRDLPYAAIADIMADGQKEGTIVEGNPQELALLFWTSINGLAIYKATRQNGLSLTNANILINTFVKSSTPQY